MAHATGKVRFGDGEILLFEYNGTVDVCCSALKRTADEIDRDWRTPANNATCSCGRGEPVDLMTFYGGGFSWSGKACRKCMAITGDLMPPDEKDDGVPDWAARG